MYSCVEVNVKQIMDDLDRTDSWELLEFLMEKVKRTAQEEDWASFLKDWKLQEIK